MTKREAGTAGEEFCAAYYSNHGYTVIGRNIHSRYGEIDVIAENKEVIAFIEVKTREEGALVSGAESVNAAKQRKCILTAMDYIAKNGIDRQPRFDVFEVIHDGKRLTKFRKTENAFDAFSDEEFDMFLP